ncbi:hypothetical protein [Yersinia intermedia]|uniref:hypothetical protein n=1 Tax=Yersinia intermedia TaxID=631 RepID=UPI00065D7538|nr:hypothetical protein [Yersinia intermedia]CRY84238.1 Uncharacterised protein [Yersinia intermedia]
MKYVKHLAESLLYKKGLVPINLETSTISVSEHCHKMGLRFNVAVKQLLFLVPLYLEKQSKSVDIIKYRTDLEMVLEKACDMRNDFDTLEFASFWLNLSDDKCEKLDFCINEEELNLAILFAERCLDVNLKLLGKLWLEKMPNFLDFVHSYCSDSLITIFTLVNRVNAKLLNLSSDVSLGLVECGTHEFKFSRKGTSPESHDLFLSSYGRITSSCNAESTIRRINDFLQHRAFPGLIACEHFDDKLIVGVSEEEYICNESDFSRWKKQFIVN